MEAPECVVLLGLSECFLVSLKMPLSLLRVLSSLLDMLHRSVEVLLSLLAGAPSTIS